MGLTMCYFEFEGHSCYATMSLAWGGGRVSVESRESNLCEGVWPGWQGLRAGQWVGSLLSVKQALWAEGGTTPSF